MGNQDSKSQLVSALGRSILEDLCRLGANQAVFFAAPTEGMYRIELLFLGTDGVVFEAVDGGGAAVSRALFNLHSAYVADGESGNWASVEIIVLNDGTFNLKFTYPDQIAEGLDFLNHDFKSELVARYFPGASTRFFEPPPPPDH